MGNSDAAADVSSIEQRHRLDLDSLARWMKDNVEDFHGPLTAQQFGIGQSNPTYRLDAGGKSYVLRRKPPGNAAAFGPCTWTASIE